MRCMFWPCQSMVGWGPGVPEVPGIQGLAREWSVCHHRTVHGVLVSWLAESWHPAVQPGQTRVLQKASSLQVLLETSYKLGLAYLTDPV